MTRLALVKVVPFFAPATRFGGVVTQAAKVCAGLAARGHRVRVVTTDNGVDAAMPRDRFVPRDGYEVYYATTRPWHRVVPYWTPTMRPGLDAALGDADLCCLHVGLSLTNRLASRIAKVRDVPFIYNAEGALCPHRLRLKAWRKKAFLASVERPLLAKARACQAVTGKEVRDLEGQGVSRERIRQIPNGIEAFEPGDGEAFRRRFGIEPEERIVLHLGRLHAIKGLDLLVDAFAQAAPPDARLVLAGHDEDGTGRGIAARLSNNGLRERVVCTGHLDAESRRDALSAATLFALPSVSEGLPNAVLEALAAGLPCLVSEQCNVPEIAEAGAGRVLARTRERFAAAIAELLANEAVRTDQAVRARELTADRFSLERVLDQLEEFYGQAVLD